MCPYIDDTKYKCLHYAINAEKKIHLCQKRGVHLTDFHFKSVADEDNPPEWVLEFERKHNIKGRRSRQ